MKQKIHRNQFHTAVTQNNKTTMIVVTAALLIVTAVAVRLFFNSPQKKVVGTTLLSSPTAEGLSDHQQVTLIIGTTQLNVEIVTTPQSITQGLSDRAQIGSDGMLFIFPTTREATFWMKNMQFGLDLVWIAQNKVVAITPTVPPPSPGTAEEKLPLYPSPEKVDMVLEVPAGDSEQRGIVIGDPVRIQALR